MSEETSTGAIGRYLENLRAVPANIRDSFVRGGAPKTDRTRSSFVFGNVFLHLGRLEEAQAHFERSLALCREVGNRQGEAIFTANLGSVFRPLGRLGQAREHDERSLALCREIGARRTEGYALGYLGALADDEGDAARAVEWTEQSLDLRRRIGHREAVADSLIALGDLRRRTGDEEAARRALLEALTLCREQGRRAETARAHAVLACLAGGDARAAEKALDEAGEGGRTAEVHHLLWRATGDRSHLAEANRLVAEAVARAPAEHRASMLANVRVNREVAAAARAEGL